MKVLDISGLQTLGNTIKENFYTKDDIDSKIWQGEQHEYDVLTEKKDDVLYFINERKWVLENYLSVQFHEINHNPNSNETTYESDEFTVNRNTLFKLSLNGVNYGISNSQQSNPYDVTFDALLFDDSSSLSNFNKNIECWMKWGDNNCRLKMRFTHKRNATQDYLFDVKLITTEPMVHKVRIYDPNNYFNGVVQLYAWFNISYNNDYRLCGNWPGTLILNNGGIWEYTFNFNTAEIRDYLYKQKLYKSLGFIVNHKYGQDNNDGVQTKDLNVSDGYYLDNRIITVYNYQDVTAYNLTRSINVDTNDKEGKTTTNLCKFEDLPLSVQELIKKDQESIKNETQQ